MTEREKQYRVWVLKGPRETTLGAAWDAAWDHQQQRIDELEQRLHFSHEAIRQYHRAHPSRKSLMPGPPEAKSEIESAIEA